jgi:hypothetical protein
MLLDHLRTTCFHLLRPLARILLRQGLTAHEFGKIANAAFVAAAGDVLRERGSEPSYSLIATLTGIHRHAVSEISSSAESGSVSDLQSKGYERNRLARVLAGWFENPGYTDERGRPLVLSLDGPAPSFASLVREFSGDLYPRIIRDELLRVGAVRMTRDGRIRALSRRFSSGGASAESLDALGSTTADLMTTLENNLTPGRDRLFADSAAAVHLPAEAVPLFRQLVARRGAALLNDIEGWLAEHDLPASGRDSTGSLRAGVSIFMFEDPPQTPGPFGNIDT